MKTSEASGIIEDLKSSYKVAADGTSVQEVDYQYLIKTNDAIENVSHFKIEYNKATDEVEILEAETINGNQRSKVEPSGIEDRDKGESRDYDPIRVRSVVFPQVRVGSQIRLRYRVKVSKPMIKERWSTNLSILPAEPVKKFKLTIESELPLYYDLKDPSGLLRVVKKNSKKIVVTNRKWFPGWVHAEKDPYFHPAHATDLWISTEKDWRKFLSPIDLGFKEVLAKSSGPELKRFLPKIKKSNQNERATALELLDLVAKEYRYFGDWRRHDGGYKPRELAEVIHSKYGDCKDLSTMVVAWLRQLGIEAHVALIYRGENPYGQIPDYKLPALNHFNHAIVYAKLDGSDFWLDPTNSVVSLDAYADIAGRPAWIMSDQPHFGRVPEAKPEQYRETANYLYDIRNRDEVKVKVKSDFYDLGAFEVRSELMTQSVSDVLSQTLEYFSENVDVQSHKFLRTPKPLRWLQDATFEFEYKTGRLTYSAGEGEFFILPAGMISGALLETHDRESDLRLYNRPFDFESERVIRGAKLASKPPKDCLIESKWMKLSRQVSRDPHGVKVKQRMILVQPFIRQSEHQSQEFKSFVSEAKRCFYRSGLLISSGS